MAYFDQIDEMLKPKTSNILAPQGAEGSAQGQDQQQGQNSGSNVISSAPQTKASAGANNAAQQGQSAAQFTQVGYNPKAYAEANKGEGQDFNLSKDTVKGAQQATEQLKQKSAEFDKGQPTVPQYSDEDIQNAIKGNSDAYSKIQQGLAPSPQLPSQKAPDFSSLKAPEILSSADALAAQLKKYNAAPDYTQGMANFDRALYQKTDAYQADRQRAQDAVDQFNSALDAEIKKYAGTDRGAELQKAQDQLKYRLGQEAGNIKSGVEQKLEAAKPGYNQKPEIQLQQAKSKFGSMIDKKEQDINNRLNYLVNERRKGQGLTGPTSVQMNQELSNLMDAKQKIAGLKSQINNPKGFINAGGKPALTPEFVTTQDEADRFNRIQSLLNGGESMTSDPTLAQQVQSPELNEKGLQQALDALTVDTSQYGSNGESKNKNPLGTNQDESDVAAQGILPTDTVDPRRWTDPKTAGVNFGKQAEQTRVGIDKAKAIVKNPVKEAKKTVKAVQSGAKKAGGKVAKAGKSAGKTISKAGKSLGL